MIEGDATLLVEGQPPKVVKVGDDSQIEVGTIHDAKARASGASVIVTYVVGKGKALASPAQ